MQPQTGSKLGREYTKALYCHPTYITYKWTERKENKRYTECEKKKEVKLSFFKDGMIAYVDIPKEITKRNLELL